MHVETWDVQRKTGRCTGGQWQCTTWIRSAIGPGPAVHRMARRILAEGRAQPAGRPT